MEPLYLHFMISLLIREGTTERWQVSIAGHIFVFKAQVLSEILVV